MLPELRQLRVKLNIVLMNHSQVFIDGHNLQLQTTQQTQQTEQTEQTAHQHLDPVCVQGAAAKTACVCTYNERARLS